MTELLAILSGGNYIDMPCPSSYKCILQKIVDTEGRTVTGDLDVSYVTSKRQITVSWGYLSPADHHTLMDSLVNTGVTLALSLRYWDTTTHAFKYGTFYVGNDLDEGPIVNAPSSAGPAWSGSDFGGYYASMSLTEY